MDLSLFIHRLLLEPDSLFFYLGALAFPVIMHTLFLPAFIGTDHKRTCREVGDTYGGHEKRRSKLWYLDKKTAAQSLRYRWYYIGSTHLMLCVLSATLLAGILFSAAPAYSLYADIATNSLLLEQGKFETIYVLVAAWYFFFTARSVLSVYESTNIRLSRKKEFFLLLRTGSTLILPFLFHFLFRLDWYAP